MEAKRNSQFVTLETLDVRVTALEEGMHAVRKDMADAVREIQSNTALTEQIQGTVEELTEEHRSLKRDFAGLKSDVAAVKMDTADIVAATKWLSTSKRIFVAGCVAAGAFCTAAIGTLKLAHMLGLFQ